MAGEQLMQQIDATLQDIRLFIAVYEEKSFTGAARRENATQSGVSQHIRKLEDRFGVRLFTRIGGAVTPTPAGDMFYRRALEAHKELERAMRELRAYGSGLEGRISVGLLPSLTRCVLAPALARFMQHNPNATVRVIEAYSDLLAEKARASEIDFAIVPAYCDANGLKSSFFLNTPEILVSWSGSPLEHLAPVHLADVEPLKLVVPGSTRRAYLEAYLLSSGARVLRRIELDSMFATLDFVEGTEWQAILPGIMMVPEIARRRLTLNVLAQPSLSLDLVRMQPARNPLSSVAEAFYACLQAEAQRINARWADLSRAGHSATKRPAPAKIVAARTTQKRARANI
jgi:LysR family transcriptional regulator, nitrogen assimilation regulatory protein